MKLFGKKALLDNINLKNITKVSVSANNDIIPVLTKKHIPYEVVEDIFFNQFDKSLKHQGIVTYINKVAAYDSLDEYLSQTKDTAGLVVIIDSIQDPYNFGAILRTCDAFGVDAVIYKKNNQVQITDLVSKASMGAINNLNLFREVNLNAAIDKLKKTGY
jgi:23S rRNA (guanosine2251-2'-O)-methyltransferase